MIGAVDLSAGYGKGFYLSGITASARAGQLTALVGPNGAGKSTLLAALGGLIDLRSGQVQFEGRDLAQINRRQRARQTAFLPQSREAPAHMKVCDILELGRAPWRGPLGQISAEGKAAIQIAAARTGADGFLSRVYGTLSGGEQARVLLARALAVDAPVLLADEPIAALDPEGQLVFLQLLKGEAARGRAVIAALHDLALAYNFADSVWVLDGGKLTAQGAPEATLSADILAKVFKVQPPKTGLGQAGLRRL